MVIACCLSCSPLVVHQFYKPAGLPFPLSTNIPTDAVWAVIVAYHPDPALLDALVRSLVPQVQGLVIMNNGHATDLHGTARENSLNNTLAEGVNIVNLGKNIGVAAAVNQGIDYVRSKGATHVVPFDQDSEADPAMVAELLHAMHALQDNGQPVGAVGPRYVDRRTGISARVLAADTQHCRKNMDAPLEGLLEVDMLITSGCLIDIRTLDRVGGMRDDLFIDHVDMEWCFRARSCGYPVYVVGSAVLKHAIGDHIKNFFGLKVITHSPIRHYYMLRNGMALQRVPHMSPTWRRNMRLTMTKQFIFYSLFLPHRRKRIPMMMQGLIDGWKGRLGPYAKRPFFF